MRIKQSDLEAVANRINSMTGNSLESWVRTDGISKSVPGNYHISYAYGGCALYQMVSDGGAVRDICGGHVPKRELYNQMQAYCSGLQETKEAL